MEELQQCWELASVAQFCSLFRETFNLPEFDIEELEEGFIADGTPDGSLFLQEIVVQLLKGCYRGRSVNADNWNECLYKYIEKKWVKENKVPHPFGEESAFSQLPLQTKVEIVYSLCVYRLDNVDVETAMKRLDADCLRVQSLGSDENGNVYWYFYGTRLYKEELSESDKKMKDWTKEWEKEQAKTPEPAAKRKRGRPRKQKPVKSDGESEESEESDPHKKSNAEKSRWSVVCTTLSDWQSLADSFEKSKSASEKALHRIITKDFLPVLKDMYEQKAKRVKNKMVEFAPRRASSRLEVKKLQRSEENRLASYVDGDEFEMYCLQRNQPESHPEIRRDRLSRDRSRRLDERRQRFAGRGVEGSASYERDSSIESIHYASQDPFTIPDPTSNKSNEFRNFIIKMRQVLVSVKLHKDAWPFLQPVDESYAPGYNDIISNPIDLSAIETKLNKGLYENINQVDQDFNVMVANCQLYNGEKSVFSTMALSLRRHFRKAAIKCDLLTEYHAEIASKIPRLEEPKPDISSKSNEPQLPNVNQNGNNNSENRIKRRKRKRPPGMRAIEALAEASAQALKNATVEPLQPLMSRNQLVPPKSQDFSDLKIVTIHSHPPSLIAKYGSGASQDSMGSDSFQYCSSLSPECTKESDLSNTMQQHQSPHSTCIIEGPTVDVHTMTPSPLLNETDAADIGDNFVNVHSNASTEGGNSYTFDQFENASDNSCSAEQNKHATEDGQEDSGNGNAIASETNQQPRALAKISSLLSKISSQRSQNFQLHSPQDVGNTTIDSGNASSHASSSPGDQDSFDAEKANDTTPPPIATSHGVDPTLSPNFSLLSTVDASILGLQCSRNLFNRNALLSSMSTNSNPSNASPQNAEKALHDALLGVELVADISKTMQELDKLKPNNSPIFFSSGSPPLMSNGCHLILANQSEEQVSKEPVLSQAPTMNGNQNMFNTLLMPKSLSSPIYPVSPDSTENKDKANGVPSINTKSNSPIGSSPSHSEVLRPSPQHSLSPQITAHFVPLTFPFTMTNQTDVSNPSNHIPLQLPPSFSHSQFFSDLNGRRLSPTSTLPFLVNSAANNLQLSPVTVPSATTTSPSTLIHSPHQFTTVAVSPNTTNGSALMANPTHPIVTSFADRSSLNDVPKNQSENGQDSLTHNGMIRKNNVLNIGNKSSNVNGQTSSNILPSCHSDDVQKLAPNVMSQNLPNAPSNQSVIYGNSSTNMSFNIPKPSHCVPSTYSAQTNGNPTQGWSLQNFMDPTGGRNTVEGARHSVIMAAHPKNTQANDMFTTQNNNFDNARVCAAPVITTSSSKDVPFTNFLAQGMPSLVTTQSGQQNVILNYVPSELNYAMGNQPLSNTVQYNVVPTVQNMSYGNVKDIRPSFTTVSSAGNNTSFTFGPSCAPISAPNRFSAHVGTKTSSTNSGNISSTRTCNKQPSKKSAQNNIAALQKHDVSGNAYLISGAHEKIPQVIANVPGLQGGVPTFFNVPHYLLPSQTGVHNILPSHMLPHSNQLYQPNTRLIVGEPGGSKTNDSRQPMYANRNVQFLTTAPPVSTTK